AGLRRRAERPRLALHARQLRGDQPLTSDGDGGRGLQHRRRPQGGKHRANAPDPPSAREARDPDRAREGSTGPRPAVLARLEEDAPAWLVAAPSVLLRACGDRRLVLLALRVLAASKVQRVPRVLLQIVRASE